MRPTKSTLFPYTTLFRSESDLEVLVVSNDKDMMQLVGRNVRTLRTGTGGAKADVIVDEKRVEEILGVPPERVIDVMRSEEHTSELQSLRHLVCRLLLEKK